MCPFSCVQACVLSALVNRGGWKEKLKRSEHTAWFNETAQSLDLPPSPHPPLCTFSPPFFSHALFLIPQVVISFIPSKSCFLVFSISFFFYSPPSLCTFRHIYYITLFPINSQSLPSCYFNQGYSCDSTQVWMQNKEWHIFSNLKHDIHVCTSVLKYTIMSDTKAGNCILPKHLSLNVSFMLHEKS